MSTLPLAVRLHDRSASKPPAAHPRHGLESKPLVVLVSALQLSLVIAIWLLALVPMALLALGTMAVKRLRRAVGTRTAMRVEPN